jgi:hypothetical protein
MNLVTPRKIAWVLVVAAVAWFIYASPKTPIQFFDAAARDRDALRGLNATETSIDQSEYAQLMQKCADLSRQMDRIALLNDIAHDPHRVDSSKSSIVDGFYTTSETTKSMLSESDECYRNIAMELDKCQEALRNYGGKRHTDELKEKSASEDMLNAAIFRMELETSLLRSFQAKVFWWGVQ